MDGPSHYAEAERLLAYADEDAHGSESAGEVLAAAQVHATLALVAAHAYHFGSPAGTAGEWRAVIHGDG